MDKGKKRKNKRKLITRGHGNEPTVIEFNLSKAVILCIAIGVVIATITTVTVITTIIEAKQNTTLAETESNEKVTYVESTTIGEDGTVTVDKDEDGETITVPVPKGYSASKIPGETSANHGFVIYEGDVDWDSILVGEEAETQANSIEANVEETKENENTIESTNELETNNSEKENQEIQTSNENADEENLNNEKAENSNEKNEEEQNIEEKTEENEKEENMELDVEEKLENIENNSEEQTEDKTIEDSDEQQEEEKILEEKNIQNTNNEISEEEQNKNQSEANDETIENNGTSNEQTNEEISTNAETGEITQEDINIFNLQKSVNQYVWVPVKDISRIYGVDSNGKLWGKLWDFPSSATGSRTAYNWIETDGTMGISSKTSYREPDVTHYNTNCDVDSNLQSYLDGKTQSELLAKELEENFFFFFKSIQEYGGFYIGRYETGGLNKEAVVRKMDTNLGKQTWYSMYEKTQKLKGDNENIETLMIWGSLWDETLQWLVDSGATTSTGIQITYKELRSNSKDWGNYYDANFYYIPSGSETPDATAEKGISTSTKIPSGSTEYTKVNNIYDLAGNVCDWTLEAYSTDGRVLRGGNCDGSGNSYQAANRYSYSFPNNVNSSYRVSCRTFD